MVKTLARGRRTTPNGDRQRGRARPGSAAGSARVGNAGGQLGSVLSAALGSGMLDAEAVVRSVTPSVGKALYAELRGSRAGVDAEAVERAAEPVVRAFSEAVWPLVERARTLEPLTRRIREEGTAGEYGTSGTPGTSGRPDTLGEVGEALPMDRNVAEALGRVLPLAQTPARAALVARALNAVADLTGQLSDDEVSRVVGARSDAAVLAGALEESPAIASLKHDDPLAAARLRGIRAKHQLLEAEGGVWTVEEVAKHLRLTRQAVDNRRRAGKLIGLDMGRRGFAYPVWQFTPDGVLGGLEAVLGAMTVRAPWDQAAFFLSGDPRLGGERPLDVLRRGRAVDVEEVKRAARGFGEHSAA